MLLKSSRSRHRVTQRRVLPHSRSTHFTHLLRHCDLPYVLLLLASPPPIRNHTHICPNLSFEPTRVARSLCASHPAHARVILASSCRDIAARARTDDGCWVQRGYACYDSFTAKLLPTAATCSDEYIWWSSGACMSCFFVRGPYVFFEHVLRLHFPLVSSVRWATAGRRGRSM